MPITYAQPEPMSTAISSGFGQSQQAVQDVPFLQHGVDSISNLYQQEANRQQQAMIAGRQFQAQAQDRSAQAAMSDAHMNTALAQSRMQQESHAADLQAQTSVSPRDQFLTAAQLDQNQQRAQLQSWLGQQDLSQKEAMRLQQIKSTLGDIDAAEQSGKITPDQAENARFKAKGIATPLEQRMQASKARELEAQAQMEEATAMRQKKFQIQQDKMDAMSLPEKTNYIVPDDVQAAAETAFDAAFPEITAAANAGGIQGMTAKAIRQKMIQDEARQMPGAQQWLSAVAGKPPVNITDARHAQEMKQQELTMKRYDAEVKDWEHDYTAAEVRVRKHLIDAMPADTKPEDKQPDLDKIKELALKEMRPRPKPPASQAREPFAGFKKAVPAPAPPAPANTDQPKNAVAVLDDTLADFNKRPVSPEAKMAVNAAMEQSKAMLAKAGGYDNLTAEEKATYQHNRKLVQAALAKAPPVPPPPQPFPGSDFQGDLLRPRGFQGTFPANHGPQAGAQAYLGGGIAGLQRQVAQPEIVE